MNITLDALIEYLKGQRRHYLALAAEAERMIEALQKAKADKKSCTDAK
jgi:hypothetical protein